MEDKTREAMLKIIEDKKLKSASQNRLQRGPNHLGSSRGITKKQRKGGLFDK